MSKFKRNTKLQFFIFSSGEKKWQTIERWTEEGKQSNKNYATEGQTVLSLSRDEVVIFDKFTKLKKTVGLGNLKKNYYFFNFFNDPIGKPPYSSLKNFDRDLSKYWNLNFKFNSTIYRKKMQTLWSQKIQHPKDLQTINTAMGHGWRTGILHYTFQNKFAASEFVSRAVDLDVSVFA